MNVIFYIFMMAMLALGCYDFHLFDVVEAYGRLRIINAIPPVVWQVVATACFLAMVCRAKVKVKEISAPGTYLAWWNVLIAAIIVDGVVDTVGYIADENEVLSVVSFVTAILLIVAQILLGIRLARSYTGNVKILGRMFVLVPAITALLVIGLTFCVPPDFGDTVMEASEIAYNTTTIVWTIVFIAVAWLGAIIVGAVCSAVGRKVTGEQIETVTDADASSAYILEEIEPEAESAPRRSSHRSTKRIAIVIASLAGIAVAAFAGFMVYNALNDDFKALEVDVEPVEIDPNDLAYTPKLTLRGWSAEPGECEDVKIEIASEVSVTLTFDRDNVDKTRGVPVSMSLMDESGNGADMIYGKGYLKDGNLRIYASSDNGFARDSRGGWTMFEAEGIDNLAEFSATVYFSPDDEGSHYNFIDELTWLRILDSTPTSVYEGKHDSMVYIQLIKPFGRKIGGVKALVYIHTMRIDEVGQGDVVSSDCVLSVIDSNGYMYLSSDPMPYLGLAKWADNKLEIIREGERYNMELTRRTVMEHPEIEDAIVEIEESYDAVY